MINARELRRRGLAGLRKAEQVRAVLKYLAAAGWLEEAPERQGTTPGRKRLDYKVNPRVRDHG